MPHKDVGRRAALDRTLLLFIKLELRCGRFAQLRN